jgi:hypothetical protein
MYQADTIQCIGSIYSSVLRAEIPKPILILLNPKAKISFTSTTQRSRPNANILMGKKTYREITIEKQANTSKIEKKKKKKKKVGKQTMRMTTTGRKPIACWPKSDAEGSIESTLRGDVRKDQQ